jgi:hypothetical protein
MQGRTTRTLIALAGTAAAAAVLAMPGPASANAEGTAQNYEVGLFGDMPYGDYGRAHHPAVIADMNAHNLAFSIFDGDTKNGSEPCYADVDGSAAAAGKPDVYTYALDLFGRFSRPVVYLPGDNEWTDCDRTKITPNFDADGRLAYLRKLSYPTDQSLGRRTMTLTRQSAAYPENVRWTAGPVTYIGLNIPGSDNNWAPDSGKEGDPAKAHAEYTARNAANLAWLDSSFAAAKKAGSKGVMISIQADMWDPTADSLAHYADTKTALARLAIDFGKPIALVNGDSHSFEMDKPLTDAATTNAAGLAGANVIETFTRVTTFGEAQNHWVSATVDARDPNVFTFHPHLIRANLPTYTAPPAS